MKLVFTSFCCIALFAANAGQAVAPARAQARPTPRVPGQLLGFNRIAQELAKQLTKDGYKKIVVLDFIGPNKYWSPFSDWLADQFSAAFNDSGYPLEVIDRTVVNAIEVPDDFDSEDEFGSEGTMHRIASSLGADAFIYGTYRPAENGVGVTLEVHKTHKTAKPHSIVSTPIASVVGKIPLTEDMNPQVRIPFDAIFPDTKTAVPGNGGISHPTCIFCPPPQYSSEAAKLKLQGIVSAWGTITPEGRVIHITVANGLGHGLDEQAVAALQNWRFKPASDVDGKPVWVRMPIAIFFRLD